ncbi:hypothetical protein [Mesorhizobium sp. GbtcB19]|uniref:hypothetical protein n=1 Tax=Mesorhizobium sp. GbtcB19 TaxID=2824764 RepID=UPI001C304098|nr:hypothetical protein [Mesorhizobium sp. GbtcB19]
MISDTENLVYEAVRDLDSSQTYKDLLSDDVGEQIRAILSISWHDDWRFAQDVCFKYARHGNPDVRNISIAGLGHIARIHGAIEVCSVLELVGELRRAGLGSGRIEDMFDDIMVFVARQGRREV